MLVLVVSMRLQHRAHLYRVMERILLDITAAITFNCAIILINCAIIKNKMNLSLSKYKKLKAAFKEK